MLQKTMKQILKKKANTWIETITDKEVVKAIEKDLIITGGCFPSMITNETPNDFDCYFRTKETVLKVAEYYAKVWNESHQASTNKIGKHCRVMVLDGANPSEEIKEYFGKDEVEEHNTRAVIIDNCDKDRVKMVFPSDGVVGDPDEVRADEELGIEDPVTVVKELDEVAAAEIEKQEKKMFHPVFISSNAITLSGGIQIIVRFYGEPDKIHDTYDFVHTKAYWTYKDNEVVIPNDVYETVTNKTLIYTGSKYPVCSVFRMRKFIKRGWSINAGQILKICMQISELDLMNINVLEDQLIGVDSLYFMNLIEQFRKKEQSDSEWKLTPSYIVSIIDKIF
jgi:hypothetical protein